MAKRRVLKGLVMSAGGGRPVPKAFRRRRCDAVYVAGQALAYWWNGCAIYSASVCSPAEAVRVGIRDRVGRYRHVTGLADGRLWAGSPGYGASDSDMPERDLVILLAGCAAESRQRRVSPSPVLDGVWSSDAVEVRTLLDLFFEGVENSAFLAAWARAQVLIRVYWIAVQALADRLLECGRMKGAAVVSLFREVTGERPASHGNALGRLDVRGVA